MHCIKHIVVFNTLDKLLSHSKPQRAICGGGFLGNLYAGIRRKKPQTEIHIFFVSLCNALRSYKMAPKALGNTKVVIDVKEESLE